LRKDYFWRAGKKLYPWKVRVLSKALQDEGVYVTGKGKKSWWR
jgi:hypothetical protein